MLQIKESSARAHNTLVQVNAHNRCRLQHVFVCEFVDHVDLEVITLHHRVVSEENPRKGLFRTHLVAFDKRSRESALCENCRASESIGLDGGIDDVKIGDESNGSTSPQAQRQENESSE